MRTLSLDLGGRRIGVAVCDDDGRVASPVTVIQRTDPQRTHREIADLVAEWEAGTVVIGLPLALDGSHGPAAQAVEAECAELSAILDVPIELHDERMTTVRAERVLREQGLDGRERRTVVDQVAASIILQDWLDQRAGSSRPPGSEG
ncbi:MAG TPA: Holliday junction resolvase RuvX [Acidimicrobiales bacterium]